VLKEREEQVAYKKYRQDVKRKHEADFVKKQKEALEVAESAEQRKLEERRARALAERDAQLQQLEELRQKILNGKAENTQEGMVLAQKAEEEVRLMQLKEEDRRQRAHQNNLETMQANDALQKFREIEKLREKEQDRKIAEFAKKKEAMIIERKRRGEQKAAAKQAERDKMINIMEDNLLMMRQQGESRLAHQAEEARLAEDMREAERAEARRVENLAIDRSRQQQLDIRKYQKDQAKLEEMEMVEEWKVRNELLKQEAKKEMVDQFKRNRKVQEAHLRQMDKKRYKQEMEKAQEMEEAFATRLVMQEDEELFKHYSSVCIEEWQAQGKNLKPMLLEISRKPKLGK